MPALSAAHAIGLVRRAAARRAARLRVLDAARDDAVAQHRQAAVDALDKSAARYRLLFEASPLPMWVYDLETLQFLAVNQAAVVQYGWSRDEFLDLTLQDIRPAADMGALRVDVREAPAGLKQASEWRHRTRSGRLIDVVITSHPLEFDGRAARLVLVTDVTDRKGAEAALRRSEARYRALAQHASDVTLVVDVEAGVDVGTDARVRDVSPSVRSHYGHAPDALVGRPLADVLHPEDVAPVGRALAALRLRPDTAATVRHRLRHADGAWRQAETIAVDLRGEPAVGGIVLTTRDVTERAALEAELAYQAYHDALTGLANRAKFRVEVARVLDAAVEGAHDPATVAVLLLDLDGFKRVNDSAGHAIGDALLVQVAERLRHATRGCDLVARLGGDEFAVLLADVHADVDLAHVADRIVGALARPFPVDGTSCVVGVSVGVARGAGGVLVDALLRNADLALYDAKARGKGRHAFFDPSMHAVAVERVALEAALREALDRGEFRVVYQPIVDLRDGRVVGAEALVRWQHRERGLVSPAAFIPLAEETGLIVPLGRWVLDEACREAAGWNAAPGVDAAGGVHVAVNVSGRQLARPEFVDEVAAALAATGLAPGRLTLELTESTVIHEPDLARERLTALKQLGVRLAIDDFGTGYSALSYLQQFPIDVLKIDKSFVDRVAAGGQAAALAGAIVALGQALSLRTVAEGVERADQQHALATMGCALGQGYLFARPLAPEAVAALLAGGARDVA